ncbi:MAG: enoyl-CoA hydratase/isomerase family protein [Proteobacteria bacterium]|nr:enoyl-CoA hydratase/isomerase family protein [Pseudomonadota bacterium]
MSEAVLYDLHSHVARITLNRPEIGNVVNIDNLKLLNQYLIDANENPDCRAVVIEGSSGVFSRGMDFQFMIKQSEKGIGREFSEPYIKAVMQIRNSDKPVIAAVDGEVLAGGLGIVLASDIVIATHRSVFGLSEVVFGIIPAYVFPLLLERVSFKKARFMVLSSRKFSAEEAYLFGLVDELIENDKLDKSLTIYLKRLLASSPEALSLTKTYSNNISQKKIEESIEMAGKQLTELLNDKKNLEAIKSFQEGEKLPWTVKYRRKK